MANAELCERFLRAIGKDKDFLKAHAHPDIVLEFPYAPWVGYPESVRGYDNAIAYLDQVGELLPGMTFHNVVVRPLAEPDAYLMEYTSKCPAVNGYAQRYINITRIKDGRIILFREYWNTSEATRALSGSSDPSPAASDPID